MFGKNLQIYVTHIPKKCIEFSRFYPCFPSNSKLSSKFFSSPPRNRNSPMQRFFEDLFSPAAERGGGNLLYQTSTGKYDGDLEQQVIYVLHDLEFVQM